MGNNFAPCGYLHVHLKRYPVVSAPLSPPPSPPPSRLPSHHHHHPLPPLPLPSTVVHLIRCIVRAHGQYIRTLHTVSSSSTPPPRWLRCTTALFLSVVPGQDLQHLVDMGRRTVRSGVLRQHRMVRIVQTVQLRSLWRSHSCSSWTRCSCPLFCPDRCIVGPDSAENRAIAAVAVPTVVVDVAASCSDKFSCSRDENNGRASDSVIDKCS